MTRIILCMIVKNEAHVIERCLSHALPVINAVCICDTGSTDGTPETIERALDDAGIPYRVPRHEWLNFGANRSRSFDEVRSFAEELGWDLDSSYALLLDADMTLRIGEDFDPTALTAGGYSAQWRNGSLVYTNTTLIKLRLNWRCIGAAHEYWSAGVDIENLDTLWIEHLGDGGEPAGKPDRNRRLLEAELAEQPGNTRSMFYLAQTYFDLGRFEDARRLYLQRASAGGWEEEAWYAAYRAAVCAMHLDGWERGAGQLLGAWERRPWRVEPLYMLARFAREHNASHTAMLAAEQALTIPFPGEDRLFVDLHAYRDGPLEEIAISAYYAGRKARGAAACDALLHHRATPAAVRDLAANNSAFYTDPIAAQGTARRVEVPSGLLGATFAPGTGSIQRTESGYVLVNRLVNYYQRAARAYSSRDPNGTYQSRQVWIAFDRNLGQQSANPVDDTLVEQLAEIPTGTAQASGVEDVRLVCWNGNWWFIAVGYQFDAWQRSRVLLGRIAPDGARIEHIVKLRYSREQAAEKSWVPFVHDGRLLLLYSCDPLVILEPDPETGACREIQRALPPVDLRRYRGSTPLVRAGDRYLGVIHEVASASDGRYYLHRFIEMDDALRITRASRPFSFLHLGIEYCCGLCLNHGGDGLIASFSFEDHESWLVSLPLDRVEAMLQPLDALAFIDPPDDAAAAGPGWIDLALPVFDRQPERSEPITAPNR